MGITTQGITTPQITDAKTSRNYLFIAPDKKANSQNKQKGEIFTYANLLGVNNGSNNRFMSTMNPFIA